MLPVMSNPNCQRYTVLGQSLLGDYFYSMTRLSLIRGVLHRRTFLDNDEIQQLVLPLSLRNSVLQSLHDDNGHQGAQRVIELLRSKVYWPSMFVDTDHWLAQCEQCHIAKGDYTEPKTQQGTLTASQPLELLCIDFTKADPSKRWKRESFNSH